MLELLIQGIVSLFIAAIEFSMETGLIIYDLFFERKFEKDNMSWMLKTIIGFIGTIIISSIVYGIITFMIYLWIKMR